MNNPYAPPAAKVGDLDDQTPEDFDYAGFWWRVLASIIDSILFSIITVPLIIAIVGFDAYTDTTRGFFGGPVEIFISYVLPIFATSTTATPFGVRSIIRSPAAENALS